MTRIYLAQSCVDRTGMATGLDDAIFTTHWQQTPPGSDLTDADLTTAATKIKAFWTTIKTYITTPYALREIKWYAVADTPPHKATFYRTDPVGTGSGDPGTNGGTVLPPQVAMSITLKTLDRKQWGRFYIPGLAGTVLNTTTNKGAFLPATCDAICAAAATLAHVNPTGPAMAVWSPKLSAAVNIQQLQVDDVCDTIRSRRMKRATYKAHGNP